MDARGVSGKPTHRPNRVEGPSLYVKTITKDSQPMGARQCQATWDPKTTQ